MKSIRTLLVAFSFLTAGIPFTGNAQTLTVNNESWATLVPGGNCNNCTITIPAGWTLLLNSNGTCGGCTFNGGTVNITSGFNFNNTTTFNNDTLLINTSTNPNNFVFNSDSVAINASLSNQNGTDIVSNCRISVNASVNFNSATLTNDSIHLNNTMSFSNTPGDFTGCHVTVANNAKINTQGSNITNSVFAFAGNSGLNISNGMTSDGSSFYMNGSSTLHASSITMKNNSNVVMTGSNSFQSDNALTLASSNITMSSTSALNASSLTATSTTITTNDNAKFKISNMIDLIGTTVTANNSSSFTGSAATVENNSNLIMTGSATLKVDNGFNVSSSTVSMSGTSGVTASSSTIQSGSSLTMAGSATLSVTNTVDVKGSQVAMNGNSVMSDNSTIVENSSSFIIGDGSLTSTAHLSSSNSLQVLDNSQMKVSNGNNYVVTNANSYTGGSTSYPISNNNISCNSSPAMHTYTNSCSTGHVYGPATLNSSGALPITTLALTDLQLSITVTGKYTVALTWSEANNKDADHFQVQRSTNGQDWVTIGTEAGNGSSTGQYDFNDAAAPAGTDYYRIMSTDKEGGIIYSKVVTASIDATPAAISIYPNPVTGHTFTIRTGTADAVLVNIFNLSGQLLFRTALKGQTQYPVNLPASITPGNYMVVQVISNEGTQAFNILNQ